MRPRWCTEVTLPTPSQTVGPFFAIGLPYDGGPEVVPPDHPDAIRITGRVFDGDGEIVDDALVETWQANPAGRYDHREDDRKDIPLSDGFRGFGRCVTDDEGCYKLVTVKPGPVPHPEGGMQAPHIAVAVFARGLLKQLVTRIYFPDESEANSADPVLQSVEEARRGSLVAKEEDGALRFDIRLQGEHETPFFDV
jgi:protocatechuate 3,4-dioxygenase alpha subunit